MAERVFWRAWWATADDVDDRMYVSDYYTGACEYSTREAAVKAARAELDGANAEGEEYVVGIERVHRVDTKEWEVLDG